MAKSSRVCVWRWVKTAEGRGTGLGSTGGSRLATDGCAWRGGSARLLRVCVCGGGGPVVSVRWRLG